MYIQPHHLQLTLHFLFEPVHDRPGRQARRSVVGVELDEHRLALAHDGFDLRGLLIGAGAGTEGEPGEGQPRAHDGECEQVTSGDAVAEEEQGQPAPEDERRDDEGMLVEELSQRIKQIRMPSYPG